MADSASKYCCIDAASSHPIHALPFPVFLLHVSSRLSSHGATRSSSPLTLRRAPRFRIVVPLPFYTRPCWMSQARPLHTYSIYPHLPHGCTDPSNGLESTFVNHAPTLKRKDRDHQRGRRDWHGLWLPSNDASTVTVNPLTETMCANGTICPIDHFPSATFLGKYEEKSFPHPLPPPPEISSSARAQLPKAHEALFLPHTLLRVITDFSMTSKYIFLNRAFSA